MTTDDEKLTVLYTRMKDLAAENQQAIPTGWFVSEDTAYAKYENRNPLVMATRDKNGEFTADY